MALLAVGFLHGELTSLLWGGAFGFVWAYVVVARIASGFAARSPRGSLDVVPGPGLLFRTPALPSAPAFFGWWLRVEGEHSASRRWQRLVPLAAATTLALELPRGCYRVVARWELRDTFGFTRLIPRTVWTATVVVEPTARPFSPPAPPPMRQGPWKPRRSGRRSGDPFDVRPYAPGDDLRRLHWPLYAHSDSPFVRTAEPVPPPTGHQFLVLDTEAASEDELDVRLGCLVTWLQILDRQGTDWTVSVPAAELTLTPRSGEVGALASLLPRTLPEVALDTWPDVVTLLTGPNSAGAPRLGRRLMASRRRLKSVLVEPVPTHRLPSPWWRRA